MRPLVTAGGGPVWLNAGVVSAEEVAALREAGVDLTVFSRELDATNDAAIQSAVATICEHHPGERLWVEFQASAAPVA